MVAVTKIPADIGRWTVSVPGFHCAVAVIAEVDDVFSVRPTRPGLLRFGNSMRDIAADFPTLDAAQDWVSGVLAP